MAVTELTRATAEVRRSRARAEADLAEQQLLLSTERQTVTEPLRSEARTNHLAQLAIDAMWGKK